MLIGNVGNDPEVRYLENNSQNPGSNPKYARFRLATTERYVDRSGNRQENTEWHTVIAWRNSADVAEKFIRKGTQVFVEGHLRTRQWQDQTGAKRETTEIIVDNLQLLGKRPDGQDAPQGYGQPAAPQGYAPAPQPAYRPAAPAAPQAAPAYQPAPAPAAPAPVAPAPVAEDVPTDDLPF